jgi:hypothetical protein
LFKLLASSPLSGLATYSSSRLFGGEECDELESEAGGCLTRFGWSCLSLFLVGFSQSSHTGLLLALQWEEAPEGFLASFSTSKWLAGDWRTLLTLYAAATGAIMGNEKRCNAMNRYPF